MNSKMFKRALCVFPLAALLMAPLAAPAPASHDPAAQGVRETARAAELRLAMRQLWEEHIAYTRNYIISALAGLPDSEAVAQRLLDNQDDIGNAIKPYYGETVARRMSALLREHILIAARVVKAAKAGDKAQLAGAQARWSANGKKIAMFLSDANPNWPQDTLQEMLQKQLDLTSGEVVGRLNKDWAVDIKAYDAGRAHMRMFADALTAGIVKQFPARFRS